MKCTPITEISLQKIRSNFAYLALIGIVFVLADLTHNMFFMHQFLNYFVVC